MVLPPRKSLVSDPCRICLVAQAHFLGKEVRAASKPRVFLHATDGFSEVL